ncbi:MAG: hypothetical protein H6819_01690 [Phycisphaerales bacterium]|nr:hypothetical protein [Phycisphaerales bacterium]MCB9857078.1 hypothetical protein [Phycisphaerales bacterium]MCB9861795.1 hypothetical protein [Phycisphaerales bacterium]
MTEEPRHTGEACGAAQPPATCPRCGNPRLDARHCKLLCLNCGYVESCEDLFEYSRQTGISEHGDD